MTRTRNMLSPASQPYPLREYSGVRRSWVTQWSGTPLRGLSLIANVRTDDTTMPAGGQRPVVLIPGVFDPVRGEYSDRLIRKLLQESAVDRVYEARYFYSGQYGYLEPSSVIEDLLAMSGRDRTPPLFIALCGAAPCLLEAQLRLPSASRSIPFPAALLVAPAIPGQLNLRGWFVCNLLAHPFARIRRNCADYSGHPHVAGNVIRVAMWYASSLLRETLEHATQQVSLPISTSVAYFERDFMRRAGKEKLEQVLSVTEMDERIPGAHKSLRRTPQGDRLIAGFCGCACRETIDASSGPSSDHTRNPTEVINGLPHL